MMRVFVRVRLSDLSTVELAPEAVIGRMRSATLRLNDPSISEAHAMVSLRGSVLKLLALRGRFMVDGAPQSEVVLREGQRIELGARVLLDVLTVSIPPEVLALRAEGLPLQALPPVATLPDMTARWEHALAAIEQRTLAYQAFIAPLQHELTQLVAAAQASQEAVRPLFAAIPATPRGTTKGPRLIRRSAKRTGRPSVGAEGPRSSAAAPSSAGRRRSGARQSSRTKAV